MKRYPLPLFLAALFLLSSQACRKQESEWIRINQLGYRPNDIKVAVFLGNESVTLKSFRVVDATSGRTILEKKEVVTSEPLDPFRSCYRLNFTEVSGDGNYRIEAGNATSTEFRIADDVYNGTADFLLNYMSQQRCGFNPYLKDSCHTNDGYVDLRRLRSDSSHIDVTGGWHDAADYLQYVATSANATYQMLFCSFGKSCIVR